MGSTDTRLPRGVTGRWQGFLDLAAELSHASGAFIARMDTGEATVLVSSGTPGGFCAPGEKLTLANVPSPWPRESAPLILQSRQEDGGTAACLALPLHFQSDAGLFGALCLVTEDDELGEERRSLLERVRELVRLDLERTGAEEGTPDGEESAARVRRAEAEAEALLVQLERSRERLASIQEERDDLKDALHASEAHFRALFHSNPHPMWILDRETHSFLAVNEAAITHYGYSHAEMRQMTIRDLEAPGGTPPPPKGLPMGVTRVRHQKKDCTCVTMELAEQPFTFAGRSASMVRAHDITEHEQEEATRARLAAIIEAMPHLVATFSPSGHLVTLNSAGRRLLRLGAGAPPALNIVDFYAESGRDRIRGEAIPTAAREGLWSGTAALLSSQGEEIPASQVILAHPNGRSGVAFFSLIASDQRDRLELEDQLRQSQKMEAIGRLAGGVAHDFNNLLMPIMSNAELIALQLREDDPLRWYAQQIVKIAERAAALPRQLLAFSRRQVMQLERLNLNAVIAETEEMLQRLIGEETELVCDLDPELGPTRADRGQVQQVILNLVVNARDAMPHGGRVTLRTANAELGEATCRRYPGVLPGPYVLLSVGDTGQGIAPEVLPRIFEPFFTTKERDKGTGLGLSMVYGIAKQSGGHIEVESTPALGSTFRVFLPRMDGISPCVVEPAGSPEMWQGSETVLVVEDEAAVRAAVSDMLRMSGYEVLTASSGAEALRICGARTSPIDLLLADVVMPAMSGIQLAEHLTPHRPEMKVLLMSGHTNDAMQQYGVDRTGYTLLRKPFSLSALANKVREVLGEEGTGAVTHE